MQTWKWSGPTIHGWPTFTDSGVSQGNMKTWKWSGHTVSWRPNFLGSSRIARLQADMKVERPHSIMTSQLSSTRVHHNVTGRYESGVPYNMPLPYFHQLRRVRRWQQDMKAQRPHNFHWSRCITRSQADMKVERPHNTLLPHLRHKVTAWQANVKVE